MQRAFEAVGPQWAGLPWWYRLIAGMHHPLAVVLAACWQPELSTPIVNCLAAQEPIFLRSHLVIQIAWVMAMRGSVDSAGFNTRPLTT